MTLKNDEKSEDKLFCRFKFDTRNSINQSINQTYIFQIMKATVFNQKLRAMI